MEANIIKLDEALRGEPGWGTALGKVDKDLLGISMKALKRVVLYFGHQEKPTRDSLQLGWQCMEPLVHLFFRELDSAGLSEIIARVGPAHLRNFEYRTAHEFRKFEEKLVEDLKIPPQAWDRFWSLVDDNKGMVLTQMEKLGFRRSLSPRFVEQFQKDWGSLTPMSPFNWSKAIAVGLGTVIGIGNTVLAIPTVGIAVASVIAAGVAAADAVGSE